MANLSEADKQYLNADQQKQIAALKDQWAAATTDAERTAANEAANKIRAQAAGGGYSGGSDGSGYVPTAGKSAADVANWVNDYRNANLGNNGWKNGYSTAMNLRSQANYIRQQMDANSQAWHTADAAQKEYLHQQNQELAKILEQANGGAQSTYNPATGRWETYNSNLGYGTDMNYVDPNLFDPKFRGNVYGQTEADWEKYRNDTDRYYNFVDTQTVRNWNDESSGFTGEYAQFLNGPYKILLGGTHGRDIPRSAYVDVIGDGFNERGYDPSNTAEPPALKYNNSLTDYTRDKAAYTENGVIMPNILNGSRSPGAENGSYRGVEGSGPNYADSVDNWPAAWRSDGNDMSLGGMGWMQQMSGGVGGFGGSGGLDGYLNSLYDASLKSQLAQLQMAYNNNLAQLDKTQTETNAEYDEQKRQTQGNSERSAANWRELALAQGLNTGAIGQAALSQNNQLQSNLNTLGAAQAQNLANIEQQRALLGQQYQLQILQAQADNDFERAQALYNEAVRQDEILRQQQAQQQAFMQELLLKSMGSGGSSGGSRSSGGGGGVGGSGGGDPMANYDLMMAAAQASGDPEGWLSSKSNRAQFGFGDWSAADVKNYYNDRYVTGQNNVGIYNNTILGDSTKSVEEKTRLAYENYDRGYITRSQLESILNQLGTGA